MIVSTAIVDRLPAPSPELVRHARKRAHLTQAQAAALISGAKTAAYKTWGAYELPPENRNHRSIPLATWELFLLLTNQHPTLRLGRRAA